MINRKFYSVGTKVLMGLGLLFAITSFSAKANDLDLEKRKKYDCSSILKNYSGGSRFLYDLCNRYPHYMKIRNQFIDGRLVRVEDLLDEATSWKCYHIHIYRIGESSMRDSTWKFTPKLVYDNPEAGRLAVDISLPDTIGTSLFPVENQILLPSLTYGPREIRVAEDGGLVFQFDRHGFFNVDDLASGYSRCYPFLRSGIVAGTGESPGKRVGTCTFSTKEMAKQAAMDDAKKNCKQKHLSKRHLCENLSILPESVFYFSQEVQDEKDKKYVCTAKLKMIWTEEISN
jgi:hypothetical protein